MTRFAERDDGVVESAFDSALTVFVFRALLDDFGILLFLFLPNGVFFSTEFATDVDRLRFDPEATFGLNSKSMPELDEGSMSSDVEVFGPFLILSNSASVSSSSAGSSTPSRIVGFNLYFSHCSSASLKPFPFPDLIKFSLWGPSKEFKFAGSIHAL